jgi:hypothetical protein
VSAPPADLDVEEVARGALATLARRSLAHFVRQAIAAGVVDGIQRVDWGPHLDAICSQVQAQLEGWLVSYGLGSLEMVERQREAWERTGATWEDGEPEPWLRYPLAQNAVDNLPPGTLKSTIVMVCANAWIWLWAPAFSFGALSGIDANVGRDSRACRELVRSNWYRETFGIVWTDHDVDPEIDEAADAEIDIKRDTDAVEAWATTAGGKRLSRTITRGLTGTHVDCVVGETLVATEVGEVAIRDLVGMSPIPRVWSMNHSTGGLELAEVRAWRKIDGRPTIDVRVSTGNVLTCTGDHRIYTDLGYIPAEECVGREVSVMWAAESDGQQRSAAMSVVLDRYPDLRDVLDRVHASGSGTRQEAPQGHQVRSVLLGGVCAIESRRAGDNAGVSVREDVQAKGQQGEPPALLEGLRRAGPQIPAPGSAVRDVQNDDAGCESDPAVLLEIVQGQGALALDDGARELQLPRGWSPVLQRATGATSTDDQGARWARVRNLQRGVQQASSGSSPHRREPEKQHPGESDHAVRLVPQRAPQVTQAAVVATTATPAKTGSGEHTVYDIEVSRNHNFFAGGVLVHNCIALDDPDDADKVYNESERLRPQNRWTRSTETRVNDEHRSIRRVLQQVVHVEGFTAYLLSLKRWSPANPKGWAQLCIPAEYGHGPKDAPAETPYGWRDWRTEHGQTMHARLSPGVLADKRLSIPGYEGQYNQNPARSGTGMFAERHARFFEIEGAPLPLRRRPEGCLQHIELPAVRVRMAELHGITLSVDAANSLDPKPGAKVSAVGLLVGACRGEDRFALDDRTRVLGVSATYQAIYDLLGTWPIELLLVELKALGAGVIRELEIAIRRGWYMHADTDERVELLGPDGRPVRCKIEQALPGKEDKVQRAHGMLPAWEQHQMYLRDGADWLYPTVDESKRTLDEGHVGELCSFPGSRRNDRVDAWSQFVARWRGAMDTRQDWRAMRRLGMAGVRGAR